MSAHRTKKRKSKATAGSTDDLSTPSMMEMRREEEEHAEDKGSCQLPEQKELHESLANANQESKPYRQVSSSERAVWWEQVYLKGDAAEEIIQAGEKLRYMNESRQQQSLQELSHATKALSEDVRELVETYTGK